MRVSVVDPAGLHAALRPCAVRGAGRGGGRRRARHERRSRYGEVPPARRLRGREALLPLRARGPRARAAARLAQHVPDMLRCRRAARAPTSCTSSGCRAAARRSTCCARYSRPRVLTAHDVLPREPRPGQRARSAGSTSASTRSSCTPSTGAARLVDELGVPTRARARDPARRVRAPAPADDAPLPPELAARRRAGRALLRPAAPVQGRRRAVEAWRGIDGRRAVGRRHAADGHRAAARGRAAGRALRPALRPRRRGRRRSSAAPTSSCCPTARSTSRACSSRRSAFGTPLLLTDVGGFPEVAAAGAAELVPPGDAGRAARRARAPARRPGARASGSAHGARCGSPTRRYAWDAIAARATSTLYATRSLR